jgi:hypothetical protein
MNDHLALEGVFRAHIRVFDIKPDGPFGERSLFYTLQGDEPGHADGMKVDAQPINSDGPADLKRITDSSRIWRHVRKVRRS